MFESMPWDVIFELRTDKHIKSFRKKMIELMKHIGDGTSLSDIQRVLNDDVWSLIVEVEPKIHKTVVTGILGNVPLGPIPINPVSVGQTIADYRKQSKIRDNYGWLFFIQHARKLTDLRQPRPQQRNATLRDHRQHRRGQSKEGGRFVPRASCL